MAGCWSVFWPQCQHLNVMCGTEFWFWLSGVFFAAFFWLVDQYMSKFNMCKSYAHCKPFWFNYACLRACYMLLLISNRKEFELRNKHLNQSHLCWTEFHSATFPIFCAFYLLCKIYQNKVCHAPAAEMAFALCKYNCGVSIRVPNLKHS